MLDVLHYYFEEDLVYSTQMESESRSQVRESIYKNLYNTEYKYGQKVKSSSLDRNVVKLENASGSTDLYFDTEPTEELSDIKPFNPKRKEVKPYTPPTQFDGGSEVPFGNILDAPMN